MGWWKTAKPGDKVVRVSDAHRRSGNWDGVPALRIGDIFVIRKIGVERGSFPRSSGVWIDIGLTNKFGKATRHGVVNFRPVQTKSTETGMAILKRILNGAPVSEDA